MSKTHKPVATPAPAPAADAKRKQVVFRNPMLTLAEAKARYTHDVETLTRNARRSRWYAARFVPYRDGGPVLDDATLSVVVTHSSRDGWVVGVIYRAVHGELAVRIGGGAYARPEDAARRALAESLACLAGQQRWQGKPVPHTWVPRPGAGRRRGVVTEPTMDVDAFTDADADEANAEA